MNPLSAKIAFVLCGIGALIAPAASARQHGCTDLPIARNVQKLGWDRAKLDLARDLAKAGFADAFMVITNGKVVLSDGDVTQPMIIASVRKSIISALYGIAIDEKRIALDAPLSRYGINDDVPLTESERATPVRALLEARSGIYIPASAETAKMKADRPARGSHPAGSFWYYNNWDFNVLGDIYQRATSRPVYTAFAARIAAPICMQDFDPYRDVEYLYDPLAPRFPAYHLALSARDLARFGMLYVTKGRWGDRQIVPAAWITQSTSRYADTDMQAPLLGSYGYLWWLPKPGSGLPAVLEDSFTASGVGGQMMTVIPQLDTVIVARGRERPVGKSTLSSNSGRNWQAVIMKVLEARKP